MEQGLAGKISGLPQMFYESTFAIIHNILYFFKGIFL